MVFSARSKLRHWVGRTDAVWHLVRRNGQLWKERADFGCQSSRRCQIRPKECRMSELVGRSELVGGDPAEFTALFPEIAL
jgi:hypothetical protein